MFRKFALVLGLSALAACSTGKLAEGRVRSALVDAGLSKANASCMAERMTDRLSLGQLKRLETLRTEKHSLSDYVVAVRRLSDPELLKVTTSAAVLCATGVAQEKR